MDCALTYRVMQNEAARSDAQHKPLASFRTDAETYARLQQLAERNQRSVAGELRRMLAQHLDRQPS